MTRAPSLGARLARVEQGRRLTGRDRRRVLLPFTGAAAVAALAGVALDNRRLARRAERENPPLGGVARFGGAALHWIDTDPGGARTSGAPVVLLHGNLVTLEDWIASGVLHRLAAAGRRVVAFDRPGFGHSERPRGRRWGAREQAAHLAHAAHAIGLDRPVVVGHSWGTLPALAWALGGTERAGGQHDRSERAGGRDRSEHAGGRDRSERAGARDRSERAGGRGRPGEVGGVVLVSGYYHPTARLDALLVAPAAAPGLGGLLRHTVAPPFARATLPSTLKAMFSPRPVPPAFRSIFPHELASRPSQIRATAREGAIMLPEARGLLERLRAEPGRLRCPVAVVAGLDDRIVDPRAQSERLAGEIRGSRLTLVRGAGHMVHHAAPDAVADAVLALAGRPAAAGERAGR